MKNTYKDLSKKIDQIYIDVFGIIDKAAKQLGIPYIVVGASARDIILEHVYGFKSRRGTKDFDLGVKVSGWDEFDKLVDELSKIGEISKGRNPHTLFYNNIPIDLIPFGDISDDHKKISWPHNHDTVLNIMGFDEAYENTLTIKLSDNPLLEIEVVDIPALTMLKIISFSDRDTSSDSKDAQDLAHIFDNYLDADNLDRLYEDSHKDILEDAGFDYDIASARLVGRDISKIATTNTLNRIIQILDEEIDREGVNFISTLVPSGLENGSEREKRLNQLKALRKGLKE